MSADDVLPRAGFEVHLRHGYTLEQVNGMSMWAVMHGRYDTFTDFEDRLEVA